jgi:hypothetical protein
MFKFLRKMSPNFTREKSFCIKRMAMGWFLLTVLYPALASAQVTELWVARYHGSVVGSSDAAVAMALDSSGNLYVMGSSQGAGTGMDYATVAYDPKGNQLWAARYNGPANGDDIVNAIAVDSKIGHVYVTGQSRGTGTGSDYATVAYDFQGNQLWVARYNGPVGGPFGGNASIAVDSKTGNVYVAGETTTPASTRPKTTTVAYDSNGNQLWVSYDDQTPVPLYDLTFPQAIAVDSGSGNVYVTGGIIILYPSNTPMARTVAYDHTGTQLWSDDEGNGADSLWGVAIAIGGSGNVLVTAHQSLQSGNPYVTIADDSAGHRLWLSLYFTIAPFSNEPAAIAVDSSTGNVYVTGKSETRSAIRGTSFDYATVAYDSHGNQLWVATYGVTGASSTANAVSVDSNTGSVYVTGQSQGDAATVAYDSKGNQLWAARHSTGSANAIAVDSNTGNVYVTGQGPGSGTGTDFTTIVYSRQDTTPPVTTATASPGPNSNGWNNTNVTVTLNSTDSEPAGSGVKQIQYALTGAQTLDMQAVPASAASVTLSAEGTTTLSYFGTDNAGNAEQSKALTVQIDKTPPVVSGMPASGCTLWPPNNQMVQVATITAADALSGLAPGSFQLTGSSNEPSGPSKPDLVITPNGSGGYAVQLRAARLGSGTGRIYTLQATATDLAGNTTTSTATCSVPRNQSTAVAH